jgi:hypothetical protein
MIFALLISGKVIIIYSLHHSTYSKSGKEVFKLSRAYSRQDLGTT